MVSEDALKRVLMVHMLTIFLDGVFNVIVPVELVKTTGILVLLVDLELSSIKKKMHALSYQLHSHLQNTAMTLLQSTYSRSFLWEADL